MSEQQYFVKVKPSLYTNKNRLHKALKSSIKSFDFTLMTGDEWKKIFISAIKDIWQQYHAIHKRCLPLALEDSLEDSHLLDYDYLPDQVRVLGNRQIGYIYIYKVEQYWRKEASNA